MGRVLTERELDRALLARQLLLERAPLPVSRAIERIGSLQTQYAPSAYVGSWSRVEGFERAMLTKALERKQVVQATLMRSTIHMVSRGDYWPTVAAIRNERRRWWLRTTRHGSDASRIERSAERVRTLLAAEGPLRRAEITGRLGLDATTWNGVGLWVDLVRVPPSGTWEQRRADLYGLAEDWIGASDASEDAGLELLIRRYLRGFGPASRKDIASFAGLPVAVIAPALSRLRLRRSEDGAGGELVDLPGAPLPDPATPAPVRFLPTWDATLLVHARRTQILPERFRPIVFDTKTPHSVATFLVDGQVAGTWRYERDRVLTEPFERLDRRTAGELADEAERLGALHR